MTLTNPWGLLFLGLMAPIVLMHLLRSDRRRVIVPSALLWDDDPDSRTAARPWQRLRWTLPLILQLLVVALGSLALAGPALRRPTPLAAHTVVVLDASLSMGARDGSTSGATRAGAARAKVDELVGNVPRGGVVSVIVAGASPRIAVARSGDDDEIRRQLEAVTLDPAADLRGAAALASGVIRPDEATSVVLVTDGGWPADAVAELPAGTRELRVGSRNLNVAVGPLSVEDQGSSMVVRAPVRSTGTEVVPGGRVELTIAVDGRVAVRRVVELGSASGPTAAVVETRAVVPKGERIVAAIGPVDDATGPLDLLTDDNAAYAVAERRVRRVLVIGTADPFLDRALESIEGLEVERSVRPISGDGADAVIYNGVSVPGDPGTGFLAIAPPGGAPGVRVIGELTNPAPSLVRTDLDVLSGLDLSGLVVGAAQRVLVGDVADANTEGDLDAARRRSIDTERSVGLLRDVTIIVGDDRGPLVFSGEYSGKPFAYVTFALRQSNLGVQVAFPLLVERLLADLGGTGRGVPAIAAGNRIAVPAEAAAVVRAPAGASTPIAPGDAGPIATQPGFWEIALDGGATTLVAVDPDPTESVLSAPAALAIASSAGGERAAGTAAASSELQSLRSLIISALLLLLIWEGVLVARRRFVPGRAKAALATRLLVAGCCVAALLGPEFDRRVDDVGVAVLVDESASMRGAPATSAAQTVERLRTAAGARRFVVVRVADGAEVTGSAPGDGFADATDLASGLRVASGALPDTMARRVVLVSDGRATIGDAPGVARSLRERGIGLDVVPVSPSSVADAAVVGVDVADGARSGEEVLARIRVRASVAGPVRVIVTPVSNADNAAAVTEVVDATAQVPATGEVTVEVPIVVGAVGVSRYSARVVMASDARIENDTAGFAVVARDAGRVLVVEGSADAARYIAPALTAGGLGVEVVTPAGVPTATGLIAYDAVVLADVGARDLSGAQTAALSSAVRDTGLGLVVLGGPRSFGFGGYLGSALEAVLPVTSDITGRNRRASVAQVLAVDTSSSMAACHCNRFDANGKLTLPVRIQGGIDKTLLAKAAAARTIEALTSVDQIGVVAFTGESKVLVPLQRVSDPAAAIAALDPIRADGATTISVGLAEARNQLKDAKADLRHIVLLTDGFSIPDDLAKLEQQAREINAEGITISVVGVGEGSDPLLERVATAGGGRFYANDDLLAVPEVVMQEAVVASRPFLVEETAFPRITSRAAPVRDLTEAPPVRGHLATTPRESAEVLLDLPIGEGNEALVEAVEEAGEEELRNPLLATWRVGLGRATAWTSDATARWAEPWVEWDGFAGFWTSVVTEALRPPTAGGAGVRVTPTETGISIEVEVGGGTTPDATADAVLVGPDGASVNVPLVRTGENTFAAQWTGAGADTVGGWVAEVSVRGSDPARKGVGSGGSTGTDVVASGTAVGVRSWPVEWTPPLPTTTAEEARESLLSLSRIADGRGELGPTSDAFAASGLRAGRRGVSLAPWLLGALLLLWPIDVAVRRLGTGRSEGPRGPRRARPTGARGVRALRRAGRFVAPSAPRWP